MDPKLPILLNFFLPLFFADILEMKLTNLSAAAYINTTFFICKNIFIHLL